MNLYIELAKLFVVASWLTVITIIDIKTYKVPEKYFKWFGLSVLIFILYNIYNNPLQLVISLIATIIFTQILYHIHGIGGADVGVLVIFSLLYPTLLHGFPFSILVFAVASIGVGLYGFIKAEQENKTITDIKNTRIPFIPFLAIGYFVVIITSF